MGLATFKRGGIHPADEKQLCDPTDYSVLPNPKLVTIGLSMHLGAPAKPLVKPRDEVTSGQPIAEPGGFVSTAYHASLPGKVKPIEQIHLGPVNSKAVVIQVADGADPFPRFEADPPQLDLSQLDAQEIIGKAKAAGLVGMGGATFPTHVKLSPPPDVKIDVLILNGAECEPYLTADDVLMRKHPVQVVEGARALMKAIGVTEGIIGIENNKPEAIALLSAAAAQVPGLRVEALKTQYPQGGEKQLIQALTGRYVPPGKLPFAVGALVQNVATAAAFYEAIQYDRPLIRRLLSVTGRAIKHPQNVLVPLGATVNEIIEFCGGTTDDLAQVVLGGPMMGRATHNLNEPVGKGSSGILCLNHEEVRSRPEDPCIRCGKCLTVCPQGLVPTEIMQLAIGERFAENMSALDCIECGSCSYVCPSNRRLVHWIRFAKWELGRIRKREQAKVAK